MAAAVAPPAAISAARKWVALVDKLMSNIERWAKEKDWLVARLEAKTLTETVLGTYCVSDLRIRTNSGVLDVEVVARNIVGAEGRVDLVSFPTMDRFLLIRRGGRWGVKTDSGFDWPKQWGKRTFIELAQQLTKPL